jgi:hypothetical protein
VHLVGLKCLLLLGTGIVLGKWFMEFEYVLVERDFPLEADGNRKGVLFDIVLD